MTSDAKDMLTWVNAKFAVALQSSVASWCGLACVFGGLTYKFARRPSMRRAAEYLDTFNFVFNMGVNLVVLAIAQRSHVIVLLCAFVIVLELPNLREFCSIDTRAVNVNKFTAHTVYMDLLRRPCRTFLVFFGQVLVTTLYMIELKAAMTGSNNGNYFYWLVAVIGIQSAALFNDSQSSQLGAPWDSGQWRSLVYLCFHSSSVVCRVEGVAGLKLTRCHCCVRCFVDFVVNALVRDLIGYTIPLFLMTAESGMDVVKDALALVFITQLDNVDKTKYDLEVNELDTSGEQCCLELFSPDASGFEYTNVQNRLDFLGSAPDPKYQIFQTSSNDSGSSDEDSGLGESS